MDRKLLIVNLKSGLCNQLNCISKSIILASITNRNVYFNNFQIDYKNLNGVIPFKNVVNISILQNIVNKLNINVLILKKVDEKIIKKAIRIEKDKNLIDISYIIDLEIQFN